MSGYNPYGNPGHHTPKNAPPNQQQQPPLGPQFRPPVAPSPYQQQEGTPYGQAPSNGQQGQHGSISYSGYPGQGGFSQEQGYFPPQGQAAAANDGMIGGLSNHMGSMGLGDEGAAVSRPNRKKNRHAYHNLDQPTPSPGAFGGMQQSPNQQPFQNTQQPATPYAGQPITPAMNQFPAQAGTTFSPGLQPGPSVFGTPSRQPMPVPSGPGVSAQGRIDPEQIPSVPLSRDAAAQYYLEHTYPTIEQHLPPPASIPFFAFDQGNSSPKYARLTLNNIPSTSEALAASGLPLGIVLQPLAPLQEGE